MSTVTLTSDSSTPSGMAVASWTGDGAALVINPGFKPRIVEMWNITDGIYDEYIDGMSGTLGTVNIAANGAVTILTSANGITVPATVAGCGDGVNGCLLAAAINVNAKVYKAKLIR